MKIAITGFSSGIGQALLTLRTVNRNITFEDLKKIMFED
jgi:hypothetical protein